MTTTIAALSLLIWLYCLAFRGGYWSAEVSGDASVAEPPAWPRIVAVIPARNEQDSIAGSLTSLLSQDYPGEFAIVLVDDNSEDKTSTIAEGLPERTGSTIPLTV